MLIHTTLHCIYSKQTDRMDNVTPSVPWNDKNLKYLLYTNINEATAISSDRRLDMKSVGQMF